VGTTLSTACGWDGSYVTLQCLSPHLAASLDLACDVLRNPSFPTSEWERIHAQTLAALRAERDSAEARTYRGLLAALYPFDHSYRLPIDGDEQEVVPLTLEAVADFHARYHGPGGASCVAAGDVDPDRLAELLDDRLDGWVGPRPEHEALPGATAAAHPRILLLDRPGAAQAVVRAGHVGMARLDPDYTDVLVLNQILGGQFTSRLNEKLREEKGFTYGIRSHFDCRRGPGPFSITASIQTDRIAEALDDLRSEVMALLGNRPPTLAEVEDARRALIEGQARHFETPASLVSRYAGLFLHGLPPDDHSRFAERLEAVTLESLSAAAAREIRPESLVFVVVADAGLVTEPLGRLAWAELDVIREQ
jgi:predicted Zn-dependent peptidase